MITRMAKVALMGPRRLLMGTLDLLHSMGVVHLEPYPIPPGRRLFMERAEEDPTQAAIRTDIRALADRVERLLVLLQTPPLPSLVPAWLFNNNISGGDLTDQVVGAEAEIAPVYEALTELKNDLLTLSRYEKVVAALFPLLQQATEEEHLDLMGIILERKREGVLPLLEKEMDRITRGSFRVFTRIMDRENIAAILAYPKAMEKEIRSLFSMENIAEIRLPSTYADKPLATTLRLLIRRQRELPAEIQAQEQRLQELSTKWHGTLSRIYSLLQDRLDEFQTATWSAQSRHTFFLHGWVPEDHVDRLIAVLKGNFGDDVLMEANPAKLTEAGEVPVQLRNAPFVRAFEPFVCLLSLPRYGSLDPTPFIAFFFPIFFGFILGDVGYGFVLMALSALMYRKLWDRPFFRSLSAVFMLSSVSCIIFGFLFGEFFGDLGEHMGMHPLMWDRSVLIMRVLYIAVGLGLAHVLLGFILNMVVSFRQKHGRHVVASAANILCLVGLVLVIFEAVGFLPNVDTIGALLLALGILLLLFTEGLIGPMELLKTFGNVLSYARLMAIGISSVVLAKVANMIGGTTESLAVGGLIALIFHTLNFVLGVFSPTIHSLRLHYVEFFGKFYQPGGKQYEPFRRHRAL